MDLKSAFPATVVPAKDLLASRTGPIYPIKMSSVAPQASPMIRQYQQVKAQHKDAILFFRLGDFYEMFFDDAEKVSKLLNLTLTSRNKNQEDSIPLCGVPHHSAQGYINKLVNLGYKVAVCEQMEDPASVKGLVKREVVQIVSPGVNLDSDALSDRVANYVVAVVAKDKKYGLAAADVSTGLFRLTELENEAALEAEIARVEPAEIVFLETQKNREFVEKLSANFPKMVQSFLGGYAHDEGYAADLYRRHFEAPLEGLGLANNPEAMQAGSLILAYLAENKLLKGQLLERPQLYNIADHLMLDGPTKRNLELVATIHDGGVRGSVYWLINQACSTLGSRRLRQWLLAPLLHVAAVDRRLDAVEELKSTPSLRRSLYELLKSVGDLERLINRVVAGVANARDMVALKNSLEPIEEIKQLMLGTQCPYLKDIQEGLDALRDIVSAIGSTLVDDPPFSLKEGGLIRDGVLLERDDLKNLERDGKGFIAAMETRERETTGISSLKIRYNRVFGYAIEVTHTHKDKVPVHYVRKQTLTQAERYITQELKEYEEKVLGAAEKICVLEYEMFLKIRDQVLAACERVKASAYALGDLDALWALATLAEENRYVRPAVVEEPVLKIVKGRHPLVEALFRAEPFVPNDVVLNTNDQRLIMITGPNMAGKSTVMRQTALIVLLAQMGSFVPADEAVIGIVDRIFTRIGASDFLQKGQSTFMVEMLETAQILSQATERSLILLDEIGRGTSTFDGLSIAWAVAETIHDTLKSRTLFATHYHELTDLEAEKQGIKNYHMLVKEWNGQIHFMREMVKGGANRSYGVFVAQMAGLPSKTIKRAREILKLLEQKDLDFQKATDPLKAQQPSLFEAPKSPALDALQEIDIDNMTPVQALNELNRIKKMLND